MASHEFSGEPSGEAQRLADERVKDLENAAEARGKAAAELTATLDKIAERLSRHDKHFDDLNGSIGHTAESLDALGDKIDGIIADQATKDAVNVALVKAAAEAADKATERGTKKLTRFQTRLMVGAGVIAGLTLALGVVQEIVRLIG
jgi:methyl-accepting chemotaxis protein